MKRKGFLLIDLIVSIFLFVNVILGLLLLLNKNNDKTRRLLVETDEKRLIFNIENIIERDLKKDFSITKYQLIQKDEIFYLENLSKNNVTKIGRYKYLKLEDIKNIKTLKKEVLLENQVIGEVYIAYLELENKKIEKIIEGVYEK
ncbi:hypothetical protein [Fusobacterium perfoetens]|uniref:hypothetical protein n=1 Tax=Fusobacterium perfoetens TaxID=852 RepID=UPI000482FE35|nr:hypothetical protein [Fusobacterium perfoetens]MCI6153316.1 hypothetical protein [Fusobacterium perfoetens]MDY3237177.1 hypothetical protein [Fusobacterium perfoetens]